MEFKRLLEIIGNEPLFETSLLFAGNVNPQDIRHQLSRWTASGKIYQLRRGLYTLAPPFQKVIPHPFLIANRLVPGSYISLQSALAYYGLIPENVPITTSVTTSRPGNYSTLLGQYHFRHVQTDWFRAYKQVDLGNNQKAFVAIPEKALLDLIYLEAGSDSIAYLSELRLQAMDQLDLQRLLQLAGKENKSKLNRAVEGIRQIIDEEKTGFESL
jgi:predicted transcriptional regulator of viral defense system